MPRRSRLERHAGAAYPVDFCQLCADGWYGRVPPSAVAVYTDVLGFRYRLCAAHALALTGFLRRRILKGCTRGTRSPHADGDAAPAGEDGHADGA